MKNISINKNLTNIFLIDGAFPLDRHKKKKQTHLIPKNKQQRQNNNKKKTEKKTKAKTIFLSISSITGKYCVFGFIIS